MEDRIFTIDREALIERADLRYTGTVDSSDEGLPIGNGTTATLVWTSPWAIKLLINRVDVYANDSTSHSFNRRNEDYSCGCGWVDINLSRSGDEVFPSDRTRQHLSVYDGVATVSGDRVTVRIVASQNRDVFAVEIDDQRPLPQATDVSLRMLRPAEVRTKAHTAISNISGDDGAIRLRQEFTEGEFYCASAVVVRSDEPNSVIRINDETGGRMPVTSSQHLLGLGQQSECEVTLHLPPKRGRREFFVGSAASFDSAVDVVSLAETAVDEAVSAGFGAVRTLAAKWWEEYWQGCAIQLDSSDPDAQFVEQHYTYFLYLMACCSRGRFAPRYGSLLFSTHGDIRAWGAQQWWTNLSLYYRGLLPTGRYELLDACLRHYFGVRDACARAAVQQWGSQGIYFPETMWFDGLEPLPDDVAEEMRELYLCRRPWRTRSERFDEFAFGKHPHSSRWNWKGFGRWVEGHWTYDYNSVPPFSPVNHFFASGGEIAYLFWKRFEFTGDVQWLRRTGYPIIKGVAEFLRNFPNFRCHSDNTYHVDLVNQGEHLRGARDTFDFLCAVKGVLGAAIAASEVLGLDRGLRQKWREVLSHTRSLPTTRDPAAIERAEPHEPERFTDGCYPFVAGRPRPGLEQFNSRFYDYDLVGLEAGERSPELLQIARNTFDYSFPDGVRPDTRVRVMSSLPVIAAKLGRAGDFRQAVLNLLRVIDPAFDFCDFEGQGGRGVLANRMTNREGVNAIGAQRLGSALYAVNEALIQSDPSAPGDRPVVRLFPAWPDDWDASFRLRVRGGFTVASKVSRGTVELVEISVEETHRTDTILVRNPWPGSEVSVTCEGTEEAMTGELLEISVARRAPVVLTRLDKRE
jgi:alpha-L-fucosidase 2